MRSSYPAPDKYRQIYARYYDGRSAAELCTYFGDLAGSHCMDLCSGEGQATKHFVDHGASLVWSIDESAGMVEEVKKRCPQAEVMALSVTAALSMARECAVQFDSVVCRQGVNYWFTRNAITLLAACIKVGGVFVFNTFNQKPSTRPRLRSYKHRGLEYGEIAYSVGNVIHTVVSCEGHEPHQSEVLWLSRTFLHAALQSHFSVVEHVDGNSSIYVCTKI